MTPQSLKRPNRKIFIGTVTSDKMNRTVVVRVQRLTKHPLYKKVICMASKFKADNPDNKAKVGNKVRIMETRPISKEKRFRVIEVLQ